MSHDETAHIARQAAALDDPRLCRDIEDMTDAQDEAPTLLADLARAKAIFQQRAVLIHMGAGTATQDAALAAMDTPKGGGDE